MIKIERVVDFLPKKRLHPFIIKRSTNEDQIFQSIEKEFDERNIAHVNYEITPNRKWETPYDPWFFVFHCYVCLRAILLEWVDDRTDLKKDIEELFPSFSEHRRKPVKIVYIDGWIYEGKSTMVTKYGGMLEKDNIWRKHDLFKTINRDFFVLYHLVNWLHALIKHDDSKDYLVVDRSIFSQLAFTRTDDVEIYNPLKYLCISLFDLVTNCEGVTETTNLIVVYNKNDIKVADMDPEKRAYEMQLYKDCSPAEMMALQRTHIYFMLMLIVHLQKPDEYTIKYPYFTDRYDNKLIPDDECWKDFNSLKHRYWPLNTNKFNWEKHPDLIHKRKEFLNEDAMTIDILSLYHWIQRNYLKDVLNAF